MNLLSTLPTHTIDDHRLHAAYLQRLERTCPRGTARGHLRSAAATRLAVRRLAWNTREERP